MARSELDGERRSGKSRWWIKNWINKKGWLNKSGWFVAGAVGTLLLSGCRQTAKRVAAPAPVVAPIVLPPIAPLRPTPKLFEYARHAPRQVALTFDAGSDDSAVRLLLAELQKRRTRATFS